MSIEAAAKSSWEDETADDYLPDLPPWEKTPESIREEYRRAMRRAIAVFAGGRVLLAQELCKHGNEYRHKGKPNRDCSECGGKGRVTGHSGSDAYTDDCFCVVSCSGGKLLQVFPEVTA